MNRKPPLPHPGLPQALLRHPGPPAERVSHSSRGPTTPPSSHGCDGGHPVLHAHGVGDDPLMHSPGRRCVVGAMAWHVQVLGAGPTLLLLHGTGSSSHSWRDIAPALAATHRVIVPDLPGHGLSSRLPAHQRSIGGMARAMSDLLRQLGAETTHAASPGAPPPAASPIAAAAPCLHGVIGHSAGAALMVRMALDGHLPGSRLIGLNAALLPFDGLAGLCFAPLARAFTDTPVLTPWLTRLAARQAQDPVAMQRLIASTGSRLDGRGIALYSRLMSRPDHIAGVLAMMADWDLNRLQRDLGALNRPLQLIVGERDLTVAPHQAQQVARRAPAVQIERLGGLGHLAHEEDPQTLLRVLGKMLDPAN